MINTSPSPISPTSALHALSILRHPPPKYPPPPFPPKSIFPTKTSSSHLFHLYLPDEDSNSNDHHSVVVIPDIPTLNNLQLELHSLLTLAQCRARNLSMHLQDLQAWICSFDEPCTTPFPTTTLNLLPPTPTPLPYLPPPPPPLMLVHEPIPGAVLNDHHHLSNKQHYIHQQQQQQKQHSSPPPPPSTLSSPVSPVHHQQTPPNPPRIKIKLGSSPHVGQKRKRMDKVLHSRTSSTRSQQQHQLLGLPALPPLPCSSTTLVTYTNKLYYHRNYLQHEHESVMQEELDGADYSHAIASKVQTVPASTFWAYLDPWLKDIGEDECQVLLTSADDLPYFIVPAAASSSVKQQQIDQDPLFSDTCSAYRSLPLATRLLASLQPTNWKPSSSKKQSSNRPTNGMIIKVEPGSDQHASEFGLLVNGMDVDSGNIPVDTCISDGRDPACALVQLSAVGNVPMESLYQRLMGELKVSSMLDSDQVVSGESVADDTVCDQLRITQHALRVQLQLNNKRRARLLQLSRLRLAYQEYTAILTSIDLQLEQAFSDRYVPKIERSKRGKKSQTTSSNNNKKTTTDESVITELDPPRPPAFPSSVRALLDKRKYLQSCIGHVFESNPNLCSRAPDESVFFDMAGNVDGGMGSELHVPTELSDNVTGEIPESMWRCMPEFTTTTTEQTTDLEDPAEIMSPNLPLDMQQWMGEPMDLK